MWKQSGRDPQIVSENTMSKITTPIEKYIEAGTVFHWASKRHYQLWFTGQATTRHRRTESVLKRLTRSGKMNSIQYGTKLIYKLARKGKKMDTSLVIHGLACTECLVRIYRSKPDGTAIPERYFKGSGSVPEWGIIYPDGKLLLFEFCTKDNFYFAGNMRGKLGSYKNNLHKIEERFQGKAVVLFVLDVPRPVVERYVRSLDDAGSAGGVPPAYSGDTFPDPFFFTDYETFLKVPFGQALQSPIYFWVDGKEYTLNGS